MLVGWSYADVTAPGSVILRGQFHARFSTHVNDPLTATALALEGQRPDGTPDQAIIVSCDRVNVPSFLVDRVRAELPALIPDFDPAKLLMSATHTHTATEIQDDIYPPPPDGVMKPSDCAELLIAALRDLVVAAWQDRQPGGVSWAYGHAVVGHNRRVQYAGGMARMYGKTDVPDFECIEGYEDHGVDCLFTWTPEGHLTGMVINLACPSQEVEGETYVSADFWHDAREAIRRRHGANLPILAQCSAAGDQSPHLLVHKAAEARMLELRGLTPRQEIGRRIANAVDEVLDLAATDIRHDVPLAHTVADVVLPVRQVTRAEYEEAQARLAEAEAIVAPPEDSFNYTRRYVMLRRYGKVMQRYESQAEEPVYPTPVHALRVGDVAFATNPFELFLDFGLRMKARSRAVQTFVVQLTGTGSNTMSGYLATARSVSAKSYGAEVADTRVGPEGGQVLVDRTLELINALWD